MGSLQSIERTVNNSISECYLRPSTYKETVPHISRVRKEGSDFWPKAILVGLGLLWAGMTYAYLSGLNSRPLSLKHPLDGRFYVYETRHYTGADRIISAKINL